MAANSRFPQSGRTCVNFLEGAPLSDQRKGLTLNPSLSVILPIYNAQATLARQVGLLLDVLPDLAAPFEILVVDDGSTDHTSDIAHDLRQQYPQLKVARHAWQRGMAAAVQTGMARSCGDIVFVQEEESEISAADIRRLWSMRDDDKLVLARAQSAPRAATSLMERLTRWAAALQESAKSQPPGIQMLRRQAIDELRRSNAPEEELTITQLPHTQIARSDNSHAGHPQRAPGFMRKLRDLAVGE
jgi:cellulose synthase/poly-beta-1,6-N-acetylglucosamine synthase-like glycosyltransferase